MLKLKSLPVLLFVAAGALTASAQDAQTLFQDFQHPGQPYRPRVWWHWMNGNITKDGIYKDLTWMKRSGIGGFHVFDAGLSTPQVVEKRLPYMTPEWKDAFHYAIHLADSLGLEATIASAPGWSETGGPWVKDEDGMKKLVWRQTEVKGTGKALKVKLPGGFDITGPYQDYCYVNQSVATVFLQKKFYRDVAVLAMRIPDNDKSMMELNPTITTSGGTVTAEQLGNDSISDYSIIQAEKDGKAWVLMDFHQPQLVRSVTWSVLKIEERVENCAASLFCSMDGKTFTKVVDLSYQGGFERVEDIPQTTARYFKMVFTSTEKNNPATGFRLSSLKLSPVVRVNLLSDKSASSFYRYGTSVKTPATTDVVNTADIVDVTSFVKDGVLTWKAPKGRWRIMRFGYGLTGKTNHPASPEATGLEVDKIDPVAIRDYYKNYLQTYVDASKGLLGNRGITYLLNDSYEAGAQTWTGKMVEEFKARRGYDLLPWLPALAGIVVNSAEETERFLFDWRTTIGDMMTEYHYDQLTDILKPYGLKRYTESHEAWRANATDGMDCKRSADIPMSAIWMRYKQGLVTVPQHESDIRESASVAHIYGQNVAAAESFTSDGFRDGAFVYTPAVLKPTADAAMASGLNLFVIHTSPHQPVDDKVPGIGLGLWGQWFDRNETWASQAGAWTDYLARSCYLLRQGKFVADVAYYYGEDSNVTARYQTRMPKFPNTYNYDFVSPSIVKDVLKVDNGQLVTATGMRYRVLWLDNVSMISIKMLRRIKQLADAGVTIAGDKPKTLVGLDGTVEEFDSLVKDIWGSGRKNVTTGVSIDKVLANTGVAPDVTFSDAKANIKFVHRRLNDGEIYWIANQTKQARKFTASFNVTGKKPQLWHADTGAKEDVSYEMVDGRTRVTLDMPAYDAVFVVFVDDTDVPAVTLAEPTRTAFAEFAQPWIVSFQAHRGAPSQIALDSLASLTESSEQGVKYFSGVATYTNTFKVAKKSLKKNAPSRILLDLGEVKDLAEVTVNGQPVGVVWHAPYIIDITAAVKAGDNKVEIAVVNPWHNRMVGDMQPGAETVTYYPIKYYKADEPLLKSGLIGPARIVGER